jgi:hypothetical protein
MRFAVAGECAWGREVKSPSKITVGDYQERACQCVRLVHEMAEPTSKVLLLEMAHFWIKLARAYEPPMEPSR